MKTTSRRSGRECLYCGARVDRPSDMKRGKPSSYCTLSCRFFAKINPEDLKSDTACWNWCGSKHGKGYGHIRIGSRIEKAHRIAFELRFGTIPDGLLACHKCDNPACVNPDHIFIGTNLENLADRQSKGRQARLERHSRAILSRENVRQIRASKKPDREYAEMFGVSLRAVCSARNGESWKNI